MSFTTIVPKAIATARAPRLFVRPSGVIGLNLSAAEKFNAVTLGATHAEVMFDPDASRIGVIFHEDEGENRVPIRQKKTSLSFRVPNLLDEIGMDREHTRAYEPYAEDGLVCANLLEPKTVREVKRKGDSEAEAEDASKVAKPKKKSKKS